MTSPPVVLLVNPTAGLGRARTLVQSAHEAIAAVAPVIVAETHARGDEVRIAHDAVQRGARALVVVGGDGSVSRAAAGLRGSTVPLAVVPGGTGNDFAKTLHARTHTLSTLVTQIVRGTTTSIDVGVVDGQPFINAAGVGFDVEVLQRMEAARHRRPRWLQGTAAYVTTALGALAGYRGLSLAVHDAAGHPVVTMSRQLLAVFANGRYFGGAFHIAPSAVLDSGVLDAIVVGDMPPVARVPLFGAAIRGAHVSHARVRQHRDRAFTVSSDAPLVFETDGELFRTDSRSVAVHVEANALRVFG